MTTRLNVKGASIIGGPTRRLVATALVGVAAAAGTCSANAFATEPFLPSTDFGTALAAPSGTPTRPASVAMAGDGTAFLAWTNATNNHANVATRAPGGTWTTQDLGPVAVNSNSADAVPIAAASDGRAVVLINNAVNGYLEALTRPPGGAFANRVAISLSGSAAIRPALAVSPNGTTLAAWFQGSAGSTFVPYARTLEGGIWSPERALGVATAINPGNGAYEVGMTAAVNDAGRGAVGYSVFDGVRQRAVVALRGPGGVFNTGAQLDGSGTPSDATHVAVTAGGAVAAEYNLGADSTLGIQTQARIAPAGTDSFGSPKSVLAPAMSTFFFGSSSVAAGPGEAFQFATAASATGQTPGPVLLSSARLIGSGWGVLPGAPFAQAGAYNARARIAVGPNGDRLLTWEDYTTKTIGAAFSPRGSAEFQEAHTGTINSTDPSTIPAVAVDGAGNGVVGWIHQTLQPAITFRVVAAGFDTVAPTISNLSIPGTGPAVFPIAFSATATDAWSTPKLKWSFGDGATADGNSATHSYESPNTYDASVTATDDAGNSSSAGGRIAVSLGDRDGDGVLSDRDCDDGNAGVRPGIRDVPGNGIDENCDGADAKFGTLATTVRLDWILTRRGVRITSLGVRGVKVGDTIKLSCTGRGCPKKLKKRTVTIKKEPKKAQLSLSKYAAGVALPAGTKLDVSVQRLDYKTRSTTWTVRKRKGPSESVRCQIPGAKKSEPCA